MIANLTQSKRFQWCMVLAALTCVSASPSTMEPKTIVAGSSSRKHSLGVVDQSDARVKRNLRTHSDTTGIMDGENEDRGGIPESIKVPESSVAPAIDQVAAAKLKESVAALHEATATPGVSAVIYHVPAENVGESVRAGLREAPGVPGMDTVAAEKLKELPKAGVIPESSAKELVPAEVVDESVEAAVTPEVFVKDHVPAAKAEQLSEAGVIPGASVIDHIPAVEVGKSVEAGLQKVAAPRTRGSWNIQEAIIVQRFKKAMGDQKFDENTGDLFKSDKYTEWSMSVDEAYKDPAAAVGAKVSTLLTMYEKDAVISMLAAGKKDPITREIAIHLEHGLLCKWMPNPLDNAGDIIHVLTFGKDKREIFTSIPLKIWFNLVKQNGKNPYKLFVTHFTTRYSDKDLTELLVVAKHSSSYEAREIATKMAEVQLEKWEKSGIGEIGSFYLLKLNEEHLATLLRSPVLSTWIDYVEMLGPDPYELLLLAMRKRVGDRKLDSILAAAKADGTNESIWRILLHMQEKHQFLERLKREYPQVEGWWTAQKSGDDVFDLLKFSEKGEEMVGTGDWNAWVAYLTFLEKQKHPEDQEEIAAVIFSVLKNRFPDDDLDKLVARAKTVERIKELAAKRSEWWDAKRTPEQVFDLLRLRNKGDMVFESPEFIFWAKYVKKWNSPKEVPYSVQLPLRLYKQYGPDLVRMLRQSRETAIAKNDEVTKEIVSPMLHFFERMKSLEQKALEETSLEKKELGKRLRTSPPALATDSSKRRKILDESKPPTEN